MTEPVYNRRAILQAELAGTRIVWRVLLSELGAVGAGRVLGRLLLALSRREPFGRLGPPTCERDELSRRQLAPAVNLYFALRRERERDEALAIVRSILLEAGKVFLGKMLVLPTSHEGLIEAIPAMVASFFNAEGRSVVGDDHVEFTVGRCRFVELLARVGASEMAPIFCEVDEAYFAQPQVPIRLIRSTSLAVGGQCCDFRFERSDS